MSGNERDGVLLHIHSKQASLAMDLLQQYVLGRGDFSSEALALMGCSRKQFSISLSSQRPPNAVVTCLGQNPIVVERRLPDADPCWELKALLDTGQSANIDINNRFYVVDLQETTTCSLTTASDVAPDSYQHASQQQHSSHHFLGNLESNHHNKPDRTAVEMTADQQHNKNADTAATLKRGNIHNKYPSSSSHARFDAPGGLSPGAGNAAGVSGSTRGEGGNVACIDLTQDDHEHDASAPQQKNGAHTTGSDTARRANGMVISSTYAAVSGSKRPRDQDDDAADGRDPPDGQTAVTSAIMKSVSTSKQAAPSLSPPLATRQQILQQDTPFKLLRVNGLSQDWNTGCVGASLAALLSGPMGLVVVSNYMVDLLWLLSACPDLVKAQQLLIVHGEGQAGVDRMEQVAREKGLTNIQYHAPPLPFAYGTHHSKAFIIEKPGGVRVMILTANMIHCDCNYKTQSIWHQDFPPKDAQSPRTSDFEDDLKDYVKRLKLHFHHQQRLVTLLERHDLSSARCSLVASVPGYHAGRDLHRYGHMRLRTLLKQEPLPDASWNDSSSLVMQCSSLGSLTKAWLFDEFATSLSSAAAPGDNSGASSQQLQTFGSQAGKTVPAARIHFVWPTVQEVKDSLEGWAAGGSIPGPKKNVSKDFLQPVMCPFGGRPVGRMRAMPHIKTYCRFQGQDVMWALQTSHNLSKAAWGDRVRPNGGQHKLFIRHYELGTLHTPRLEAAYRCHRHKGFSCDPVPATTPGSSQPATLPRVLAPGAARPDDAAQAAARAAISRLGKQAAGSAPIPAESSPQAVGSQAVADDANVARPGVIEEGAVYDMGLNEGDAADSVLRFVSLDSSLQACRGAGHGLSGLAQVSSTRLINAGIVRVPVPLPYALPPDRYSRHAKPWMVDEHFEGPDIFGYHLGMNRSKYGVVQDNFVEGLE